MNIEPFYTSLGNRIQQRRTEKSLSQSYVGKELEPRMTRASVANIEAGKQRVLAHTLIQLSRILDIDLNELKHLDEATSAPVFGDQIEEALKNELSPETALRLIHFLEGKRKTK